MTKRTDYGINREEQELKRIVVIISTKCFQLMFQNSYSVEQEIFNVSPYFLDLISEQCS